MVKEVGKSQWIRIYNILVMCPWMIHLANKYRMTGWEKAFMVGGQVATLLFNLRNLIIDSRIPKQYKPGVPFNLSTTYEHPEEKRKELVITQKLRWIDILLYGPMCMIIADKYDMTKSEEFFLWYTGASTITVNGLNYYLNREVLK